MNDIAKEFDKLIHLIENSDDYKKYLFLKEKLQSNADIMKLIDEIKKLQKVIVKKKSYNEDTSDEEKQIKVNLQTLENIPLYVEFDYLQKDLNTTFQKVKTTIEDCINKITN